MKIDGACHCGLVSFTAEIDQSRVMLCHCTDCQILSGSPFRAVVAAPIESFSLKGEPKSYVKTAQSGNRRAQVFCPQCGTPLYATGPDNPTSVVTRLGCVTQRSLLKPAVQIWEHSALPWLADLPTISGSPQQQAFLPAAAGRTTQESGNGGFPFNSAPSALTSRQPERSAAPSAMQPSRVTLLNEPECRTLEAFLVERIYEFNAQATGHFDGRLIGGSIQDADGRTIAGFCGHTWGGSCEITNVWVTESHRRRGLGQRLLRVAEAEALRRGCRQVVLLTHSFQAPEFYAANGYVRKYAIEDMPAGHSDVIFVKRLSEIRDDPARSID